MTVLAERFPAISGHLAVLRESWRKQSAKDRIAFPQSDYEFLPPALEIMEKPPSPGLRILLLLLCGFIALAIVWICVGTIDVVAIASGKIIPAGNSKVVQSMQIGSVKAIYVRDGDFVRAGQLLIDLDSTIAGADENQSSKSLLDAQLAKARDEAILSYLNSGRAEFNPPAGASPDVVQSQKRTVSAAIAAYETQRSSLVAERSQRASDLAAAEAQVAKLTETRPFLDKQVEARRNLFEKGYFSKLKLLEYEQFRVEQLKEMDVQMASEAKARAAVQEIDAQLQNLRATFERSTSTEYEDSSEKVGAATQDVLKARRVNQLMRLHAPVDGVVQQLAVSTIGGVVEPAQPLMVIVPCNHDRQFASTCRDANEVQAYINNRDIGFVHIGQRAVIKLEAFNFTEFGFMEGRVSNVSRDSVETGSRNVERSDRPKAGSDEQVYVARILLKCEWNKTQNLCAQIKPGMVVQAEIVTGSRRIIEYILSPLSKAVREAGRER